MVLLLGLVVAVVDDHGRRQPSIVGAANRLTIHSGLTAIFSHLQPLANFQ
jgi:hypothetical protein